MKGMSCLAIYMRLSLEDRIQGGYDESGSITSQRKMLLEYIRKDTELAGQEVMEFCDDGVSGTSMDRPGVQELLKQVKQGRVKCILVKDMSRFSRDYIELGTYLNQVFPFLGVRFTTIMTAIGRMVMPWGLIRLSRHFYMTYTARTCLLRSRHPIRAKRQEENTSPERFLSAIKEAMRGRMLS